MVDELQEISESILGFGFGLLRNMTEQESIDFEKEFCYTRGETIGKVLACSDQRRFCFLCEDLYDWVVDNLDSVGDNLYIEEVFFIRGNGYWVKCIDILDLSDVEY